MRDSLRLVASWLLRVACQRQPLSTIAQVKSVPLILMPTRKGLLSISVLQLSFNLLKLLSALIGDYQKKLTFNSSSSGSLSMWSSSSNRAFVTIARFAVVR